MYTLRVKGIVLLLVTLIKQQNKFVYSVKRPFALKFEFGHPTVIFGT